MIHFTWPTRIVLVAVIVVLTATATTLAQPVRVQIRRYVQDEYGRQIRVQDSHDHYHQHQHQHQQVRPTYDYSRTVRFAGRSHLDALSADLKYRSNAICWEMYRNYRTNPGYRETYREAYQMLQDAKHIYTLVWENEYHRHAHGNEDHIASDLVQIDKLFHHIEDDIARWRPDHINPHHPGSELHRLTEGFEETLHHLMEDYGIHSEFGPEGEAPPPDGSPPPPPGVPGL